MLALQTTEGPEQQQFFLLSNCFCGSPKDCVSHFKIMQTTRLMRLTKSNKS